MNSCLLQSTPSPQVKGLTFVGGGEGPFILILEGPACARTRWSFSDRIGGLDTERRAPAGVFEEESVCLEKEVSVGRQGEKRPQGELEGV